MPNESGETSSKFTQDHHVTTNMLLDGRKRLYCIDGPEQTHQRYMASANHCPICHIFTFALVVGGAVAPKGSMTYDFTRQFSPSLRIRI